MRISRSQRGGFDRTVAGRLGETFDFTEIGTATRNDQADVWTARRGKIKRGGESVVIHAAQGHELDLTVEVLGDSAAADGALEAVWQSLAGASAPPLGTISELRHRTTAILHLPIAFSAAFPLGAMVREHVLGMIGKTEKLRPVLPRFSIEIVAMLGPRAVNRSVTFEPRATTSLDKRIWYTMSPLRSEDHAKLLEHVLEKFRGNS